MCALTEVTPAGSFIVFQMTLTGVNELLITQILTNRLHDLSSRQNVK
jgi:hypothetical protein